MTVLTDMPMVRLEDGRFIPAAAYEGDLEAARANTIAWRILKAHNQTGDMERLQLRFDAAVSPDNNYTSILQTVGAVGCERFPIPWVLTNCHNTLSAVGGTINNDDHEFGLGNAKRLGGIFVPPYCAVIHQYMREQMAGCGRMILGSDSHTRYGAVGTLGIGEGGGEVAKQILGHCYELTRPPVVAVHLTGEPRSGTGPMDVALEMIGATFKNGFNKNKILEFVGDGVGALSMEYRIGIDVMTTESAALSSIWVCDAKTRQWLENHGHPEDYHSLAPVGDAYYDGLIEIDLSTVEPMIALPFHPSNVYTIRSLSENEGYLKDVLREVERTARERSGLDYPLVDKVKDKRLTVQQAVIGGCAGGTFENLSAVADILEGCKISGGQTGLGVFPASQPIFMDAVRQGIAERLIRAGVTIRPCICGPCFGACDIPADGQLSIRHVTRNYYTREGSKPRQGQFSASALMDARSIAATVQKGGRLTAASELETVYRHPGYRFDPTVYEGAVYYGFGKPQKDAAVPMGPNIADWPEIPPMKEHVLLRVACACEGSITTDELCPSGDATAYRSNPHKIADFTLISRDREYLERAKAIRESGRRLLEGECDQETGAVLSQLRSETGISIQEISYGSVLTADQIGDGSSREQAASNQKILGGMANLAGEYATKRYRSNCINWGLIPLVRPEGLKLKTGDFLLLLHVRSSIEAGAAHIKAYCPETKRYWVLPVGEMTEHERKTLLGGCMINYYRDIVRRE